MNFSYNWFANTFWIVFGLQDSFNDIKAIFPSIWMELPNCSVCKTCNTISLIAY